MRENFLTFRIDGGTITVTSFNQFENRGENALVILGRILEKCSSRLDQRVGFMAYGDIPPHPGVFHDFDLGFCSTKVRGERSPFVGFPCPNSISWPTVGIVDGDQLLEQLLENTAPFQDPRAFWIGANTHPSRFALAELSRAEPEILDAELMGWKSSRKRGLLLDTNGRYVTLPDHARYKYLVDCPGIGHSGRLRWLLATGRPVFVVDRRFVEHWHEELVPWEHYIPVREDLQDFTDAFEAMEADPMLYQAISRSARQFVARRLGLEAQIQGIVEQLECVLP